MLAFPLEFKTLSFCFEVRVDIPSKLKNMVCDDGVSCV